MDNFNTDTTSHILSGPLQEQDKRIQEAPTTVMSSTRPFKKRRIVTIKPDDVAALEQPRSACKGKKKKAQQPRTTKKPKKGFVSPSPPSSPVMVMKKSVTWNEQGGNIFHLQPDSCVNDGDLWYTVSQKLYLKSTECIANLCLVEWTDVEPSLSREAGSVCFHELKI